MIYTKRKVLSEKISNSNGDSKKPYELIMILTGSKVMYPLPGHNNDTKLANEFTQFFITKIDTIREKFTNIALYGLHDSNIPRLQKFDTMSEEDIKRTIMLMKSKRCDLDPILTTFLKDMQQILLPYLTEIINKSFTKESLLKYGRQQL